MKAFVVWRAKIVKNADALEREARISRSSISFEVSRSGAKGRHGSFVKGDGRDVSNQAELQIEIAGLWRVVRNLRGRFPGSISRSEIDVGVCVGSDDSFAPSVRLLPRLMKAASELNVDFVVSCYPRST